jgi:peptide/nickel transport system substrate-binding protein
MRLRRLSAVSACVLVSLASGGCGNNSGSGAQDQDQGGSPASRAPQGTLVVDKSFDLKSFDPARTYEPTGQLLERPVYDTLLTYVEGDVKEPAPMVAESYEASGDAKEFTFKLRDDVKFSDGTPLSAADVVYSLRRVKFIKSSPSFLMDGLTVTAPDRTTVVIRSETPNAAVPAIVTNPALGIVNSKVVQANGGDDSPNAAKKDQAERFLEKESAGSGPYVLDSYGATTQVTLRANTSYWGAQKPAFERIVARNVQAPTQKLNVQRGDSQIALDLSSDQLAGLDKTLQVKTEPSPNLIFLFANANPKISEVTSTPEFRDAVRKAIDYEGFVQLGGRGARQAPGVIPSMILGALPESDAVTQDLAGAKEAVAAANAQGKPVVLEYPSDLTLNGLSFGPLAQRLQSDLADVGITVKLKPTPVATALDTYRAGKEEMGLWYWGPDYPDPAGYLVFTPGKLVGLRAGWPEGADPDLEAMATDASKQTGASREGIYQEIQRELNASSPFFPLMQPASNIVADSNLRGIVQNPSWTVDLAAISGGG